MGKYKSKTLIWFHLFFRVLRSMHIVKLVLLSVMQFAANLCFLSPFLVIYVAY